MQHTDGDTSGSAGVGNSVFIGAIVAAIALVLVVTWIGRIPWEAEDPLEPWVVLSLAFILGIGGFLAGISEYKRRTLVTNTPTSKIRSLAMGTVELQGKAKPNDDPLKAPISGVDCVLYKYKVEELRKTDDDREWVTIHQDQTENPFYIDDGTGRVKVDSTGADLRLPMDKQITVDSFNELPSTAQRFIEENPEIDTQQDELFEEDRRYTEWRIDTDQLVYVFGEAMPRGDKSSIINPENAVINEDISTPMFVISDRPESEVVSSLTRRAIGFTIGGFILAIAGFTGLTWYLGLL